MKRPGDVEAGVGQAMDKNCEPWRKRADRTSMMMRRKPGVKIRLKWMFSPNGAPSWCMHVSRWELDLLFHMRLGIVEIPSRLGWGVRTVLYLELPANWDVFNWRLQLEGKKREGWRAGRVDIINKPHWCGYDVNKPRKTVPLAG